MREFSVCALNSHYSICWEESTSLSSNEWDEPFLQSQEVTLQHMEYGPLTRVLSNVGTEFVRMGAHR
ncbi:hypothetical protein FKM82_004602 [Ascaphus truei]